MRPGLLCPGKAWRWAARSAAPPAFNEAGAVMPRKRHHRPAPCLSDPHFNEAGAVMPRKRLILRSGVPGVIELQ